MRIYVNLFKQTHVTLESNDIQNRMQKSHAKIACKIENREDLCKSKMVRIFVNLFKQAHVKLESNDVRIW